MRTFGNLGEICAAPLDRLTEVKGIGEKTALDLRLLHTISTHMSRESVLGRPVLSSWNALLDYCRTAMQFEPVEQFRVLFLDRKNRLIADEVLGKGTIDRAPVYPREIVKRGLALEASAIILAHNHPSGDPTPSQSDIDMTFMIVETCNAIGISVHDHLVIGRLLYSYGHTDRVLGRSSKSQRPSCCRSGDLERLHGANRLSTKFRSYWFGAYWRGCW